MSGSPEHHVVLDGGHDVDTGTFARTHHSSDRDSPNVPDADMPPRFARAARAVTWLLPRWVRRQVVAQHYAATVEQSRRMVRDRVRRGEHLGPVPYGYRRVRVRASDEHVHSGDAEALSGTGVGPRWVLVADPRTAPVVELIFHLRIDARFGPTRIARLLATDPEQYPRPHGPHADPTTEWTPSRVRHILSNPVYTGITVHGRTHRGRHVPSAQWVTSGPGAHPALVSLRRFRAAQSR